MKTKIMLAAALALSVALVGTARPVPGNDTSGTVTVIAETAMPAPASFEAAFPPAVPADQEVAAAAQATEQEKAKAAAKAKEAEKAKAAEEAAKAKAAVGKTIVISPKGGEGKPIEVVITEGGETKTLVFEKPLTLTTSKDGQTFTLKLDGKEIQVLKGEPLRLEIKGGELQVVKEPGLIKIGEGGGVTIVKEGGEEGKTVVFYGTTEPEIAGGKVKIVKEGEPGMAWTVTEGGKEGVWVAKEAPGKEGQTVKIVKKARPEVNVVVGEPVRAYAFTAGIGNMDMLEKVQALQEQVQAIKAKKMDLSALEESLKKLEAELRAKEEKLKELEVKVQKAPGEFTVVKRVGGEKAEGKVDVWVMEKDKAAQSGKAKVIVGVSEKDGRTINLIFTGQEGEAGKAAFERAIATLKKELPEGYKLAEQEFDADKGTMTFKIAGPDGKKLDETLVRKLVEAVQRSIKSEK
jgi:hypothetical protein